MPLELNEKLEQLHELLKNSVTNLRQSKPLQNSTKMTKAASLRDLNTNKLAMSRLDRKPSPVKGKNSARAPATSFVSRVSEKVRSPLLNSISLSGVYPPTNPQQFRRLKAMRSQEKLPSANL